MNQLPALQTNNLLGLVDKGIVNNKDVEVYTLTKTRGEKPTLKELGSAVTFLVRDVGAKTLENYDVVRIATFIQQRYSEFSVKEIKTAFEFCLTGEYQKEIEHFGNFSLAYVAKVLNAYREKRRESNNVIKLALPEPEIKLSEEEIKKINDSFLLTLDNIYNNFLNEKNIEHRVSWIIYEWLDARGLINLTRKQKQKCIDEARKRLREERQALSVLIQMKDTRDPEENVKGVAKGIAVIKQFEKFKANGTTTIGELLRKKKTTQV